MKLIPEWRSWWRFYSTWIVAVIVAIPPVWVALPLDLKSRIPDEWMPWVSAAMFIAFMVGRLRAQK